jgi:EAL domain-containing protein (putative c-di-GMP-specific phosphodiesterase class I)
MGQHAIPRHDLQPTDETPVSLLADLSTITAVIEATEPPAHLVELVPHPWSVEAAADLITAPIHLGAPVRAASDAWLPRRPRPDAAGAGSGNTGNGTATIDTAGRSAVGDDAMSDAELRTTIEAIIRDGGPAIVFQPVIHLETGRVIGAEALSRFPGPLDTRAWFDAAERLGIGDELELGAVDAALRRLDTVTWERVGWDFVGLNVSTRAVFDPRFLELVARHPAERLVVELTEQNAVPALPILRDHLDRLHDLHVRIAVNGVKATPADIDRVMMIEPGFVKLDVAFTDALVREPGRRAEAAALLDRCRREGVSVIAVGVEAYDELALLRRLGIDAVQGHLFGLPYEVGRTIR